MLLPPPNSTLFPYTTLFRSDLDEVAVLDQQRAVAVELDLVEPVVPVGKLWHETRGHGWEERSEEHTSELQSRGHLVCRLLLEKKNIEYIIKTICILTL